MRRSGAAGSLWRRSGARSLWRRSGAAGAAALVLLLAAALVLPAGAARAAPGELRVSRGYGLTYLPLYVMQARGMVEAHAARAGIGTLKVSWLTVDGGNLINDAMLAGQLDIASIGIPGFMTLWDKARGNARYEIRGVAQVSSGPMYVNTRRPEVKTLADLTERDRIALPGIKTSYGAVVLQMLAAKAFGEANYAKLDPLTVALPYPDAMAALIGGKTEVTTHIASQPFGFLELDQPGIHRIVNSVDVLGPLPVIMTHATRTFRDANPALIGAFIAALDEACELIQREPETAAAIYSAVAAVKTSNDQVRRILADPDTRFGSTPVGIMQFANFMHRVGTLKHRAADWKELFFPEIHGRDGS